MQPEKFLDTARVLAAGSDPAQYRSAISRAYYAVYNTADRFLARMNFQRPKQDYHDILQKRLLASGDPAFKQLGSNLGDFHRERVAADYHMDKKEPEGQRNAQAAVMKAQQMIAIINGCPINGTQWKEIQISIATVNVTGIDNLAIQAGS